MIALRLDSGAVAKPRLLVIVASTRPTRRARAVADWFIPIARGHDGFEVHEADLAELGLPLLDELDEPSDRRYRHEHTVRWSELVGASDAIVFVTPEYNHGYPASLKNAIDCLYHEWLHKPLGFVSYGASAGGTRSVQQLKQVAAAVMLYPAKRQVNIVGVRRRIDDDGNFVADDAVQSSATGMLDELVTLDRALSAIRQAT